MEKPSVGMQAWRYLKPTLIIVAAALLITGGTFFFWGGFTWRTYSDRLFWAGIGAVVVGGIATWSALGSYSTLGTPNVLTAPGDARIAHSRVAEHIKMNAKRYTASIRWLAAGAICMVISALVEILTR
jgi:hypothetical protein